MKSCLIHLDQFVWKGSYSAQHDRSRFALGGSYLICTSSLANEWMNERIDEWINELIDEWIDRSD